MCNLIKYIYYFNIYLILVKHDVIEDVAQGN